MFCQNDTVCKMASQSAMCINYRDGYITCAELRQTLKLTCEDCWFNWGKMTLICFICVHLLPAMSTAMWNCLIKLHILDRWSHKTIWKEDAKQSKFGYSAVWLMRLCCFVYQDDPQSSKLCQFVSYMVFETLLHFLFIRMMDIQGLHMVTGSYFKFKEPQLNL